MIGETLGQRYTLIRLLGQGGMGSVYEAEQRDTLARVAVKVLHSHLLDPGGVGPRGFRREAQAARAIRGDHIVAVLDAGTDEDTGHLYLVTELLEGEDLQRLLDHVGPLVPEAALRVASQALLGLSEAHEARVIHRDIKPANLFLARRTGPRWGSGPRPIPGAITVKLLDFGIAKIRPDPLASSASEGFTTTTGILGSPLYMSPEQVQSSRDVDHRTDLWSLGCVLYAALTGHAPHQHLTSIGQLLVAICVSPAPRLSDVAPWVPPEIAAVVHRALALRPDDRYPSAAAMLDAIRGIAPDASLAHDMLTPAGERPRPVVSTIPPSPGRATPRVVVAASPDPRILGDAVTQLEGLDGGARPRGDDPAGLDTLASTPGRGAIPRSAVPSGAKAGARFITVDPRRLLGEKSEIWTFSLDVHPHVASLVARIYRSLRRAGATLPPMTYGLTWILFEPRTERAIAVEHGESLEAAGIRPGAILWVIAPGSALQTG